MLFLCELKYSSGVLFCESRSYFKYTFFPFGDFFHMGHSSLLGLVYISYISCIQATGAWLLYKSNTREENFLYATLKGFSVFDDREGTKDELRLVIGKSATVRDTSSADGYDNPNEPDSGEQRIQKDLGLEPIPSMLILDAIFRKSSSSLSLCVQRPKFLVALDFLLAIVEFFVPSARSLLSNDEDKDLLHMISPVILNDQIYYQEDSTFSLSPQKPLIVDNERFDHFIYDGKGGKLYLLDREDKILSSPSSESFIHVLGCKRLQFRNVTIVVIFCASNFYYSHFLLTTPI